jgi:phenylacetaldehyde dehydrogenase
MSNTSHLCPAALSDRPLRMLINGTWHDAQSGETLEVLNPSFGTPLARMPLGNAADIDLAVRAARDAFDLGPWGRTSPKERARLLWRLAELIDTHADELALLETLNTGKPLQVANGMPTRCARPWVWPV